MNRIHLCAVQLSRDYRRTSTIPSASPSHRIQLVRFRQPQEEEGARGYR